MIPATLRHALRALRCRMLLFVGSLFWLIGVAGTAGAATRTWKLVPTDSNWGNLNNWAEGASPAANDDLVFGVTYSPTANNNLAAGIQIDGIVFTNAAMPFSIGSSQITLNGNITVQKGFWYGSMGLPIALNGNRTITVNSGVFNNNSLTLSGAITQTGGTWGLTKAGTGMLVLSNNGGNTFAGTITIGSASADGGVLYTGNNALPDSAPIDIARSTLQVSTDTAGPITFKATDGPFTNLITRIIGGTLTLGNNIYAESGSRQQMIIDAGLTLNGTRTIQNHTYDATPGSANEGIPIVIRGNIGGGANGLTITKGTDANAKYGVVLSGTASYTGPTTITDSKLQLGEGGTVGQLANTSTLTAGGTDNQLIFNRADTMTQGTHFQTAAIGGALALVQNGRGQVTLNQANTYTGGTTVNRGTILLNGAFNMPATGALTVNAGGTFSLADGTVRAAQSCATLTLADGAVLLFDRGAGTGDRLNSTGAATASGSIGVAFSSAVAGAGVQVLGAASGLTSGGASYFLCNNVAYTVATPALTVSDTGVTFNTITAATQLSNAYWKGGQVPGATSSMNYSTGALSNWATDAAGTATALIPGQTGCNVYFGVTGGPGAYNNPVLNADMICNQLFFNSGTGAVTIGGSHKITYQNHIYAYENATINCDLMGNQAIDQYFHVDAGHTLTLNGTLNSYQGNFRPTKDSPGTLVLNAPRGANMWPCGNGAFYLRNGTVKWGNHDQIPEAGGNTFIYITNTGTSSTLDLNGHNETVGSIQFQGGGTQYITTGSGTLTVLGNIEGNNAGGSKLIEGKISLGRGNRRFNGGNSTSPLTIAATILDGGFYHDGYRLVLSGQNTFPGGVRTTAGGVNAGIEMGADSVGTPGNVTSGPLGVGAFLFEGGALSSDGGTARNIINPVALNGDAYVGNPTRNGYLTFQAPVYFNNNWRYLYVQSDCAITGKAIYGGFYKRYAGTVLTLANPASDNNCYISVQNGTVRLGAAEQLIENTWHYIASENSTASSTLDLAGYNETIRYLEFQSGWVTAPKTLAIGTGTLTLTEEIRGYNNANGPAYITSTGAGALSLGTTAMTGANPRLLSGSATTPLVITAPITSGAPAPNLAMNNAGRVTFAAQNTFAGNLYVQGGNTCYAELGVDPVGSVGAITSGPLGLGTFYFQNGGLSSDGATARNIINPVKFTSDAYIGHATRNGYLTFQAPLDFNGSGTRIWYVNSDATFSGILSNGGGASGFDKRGTATLTLSNDNTYTGGSTITLGKVIFSGNNAAATGGMTVGVAGQVLGIAQFNSPASIPGVARNITVTAPGAALFDAGFGAGNIPGALLNRIAAGSTGALAVDNYTSTDFDMGAAGLTALSLGSAGANTYTGVLTAQGGTYRVGGGNGTLKISSSASLPVNGNSVVINGNGNVGTVDFNGGTYTFNGGITISGGTVRNGTLNTSGTITVNGSPNLYVTLGGSMTLSSGTLTLNAPGGGFSGTLTMAGGGLTLKWDDDGTGRLASYDFAANILMSSAGTITVDRVGAVGSAMNKTLQLGTLSIGNVNMAVANQNGFGLEYTGAVTLTAATPTFTVNNYVWNGLVPGLTLSGVVQGAYGFSKAGAGLMVLSNAGNTFGAPSTITISGGLLGVTADGCLGAAGNIVSLGAGSAGIQFRSDGTYAHQINTAAAGAYLDVIQGATATLSTAFNGGAASANAFTKTGDGVLEFTANNNGGTPYTGVITINAGAIRVSNNGALGAPANNTIVANNSGAALQLNGVTITELLTLNNTGINYGGALQNVGGTSTVNALITLGSATVIGADAGTTLNINNGFSGGQALTFNPASGAGINIGTTAMNAPTPINKYGVGTVTINTVGTTTQPFNLYSGTLAIGGSGTLGGTGLITTYGGSTLSLASTAANRLGGNRALTMYGGTLSISGAAAEATSGALTINNGPALISSTSGLALTVGSIARTVGLGGTALFQVTGASTVVSTGAPTYIGQTGATGATNKGIYPWALYDSAGGSGMSFATMNSAAPYTLRVLNAGTEMVTDTFTANANVLLTTTPAAVAAATTVNSLTLNNANSGVVVNPGVTLTLASGGILNTVTSNSGVTGGYLALGGNDLIVHALGNLTIGSTITGTSGITKTGAGTLTLSGDVFLTYATPAGSGLQLNGGSLIFSGPSPVYNFYSSTGPGLYLNKGATLDLGTGRSLIVGTLYSNGNVWQGAGTGGTVTGVGGTLQTRGMTGGQVYFSGDVAGSLNWNIAGSSQSDDLILLGPITTTGDIKIQTGRSQVDNCVRGLTLRDEAKLGSVNSITIGGLAGGLSIDNSADNTEHNSQAGGSVKYLADRVSDSAPIQVNGGGIAFFGRAQTDSTETLGPVTLNSGNSLIAAVAGAPGSAAAIGKATLTLSGLTRKSYASLNVVDRVRTDVGSASTLGQNGNYGRILVSGGLGGNLAPVNGVVPGVFSSQNSGYLDLVAYVADLGFGPLGQPGFPSYYNPGGDNFSGATASSNVKGSGTVPNGGLTINSLNLGAVTFTGGTSTGGDVLTVNSGMIAFDGGVGSLGSAAARGKITSGAGRQELFLVGRDGAGTRCAVNSVLTDNGSPVAVIVTGAHRSDVLNTNNGGDVYPQYPSFTARNEYTGGTFVNKGGLVLAGNPGDYVIPYAAACPTNGLVLNNSMLWLLNAGQIDPRNVLRMNGNCQLWYSGTHTIAGLVINHDSGRGWWYESVGINPSGPSKLIINGDITANLNVPGTRGASWGSPSSTPNQIDFAGQVRNVTVNIPACLQTGDRTPTYPQVYHDHQNTMLNAGAVKKGKGHWAFGYYPRFDYGLQIEDGAVSCQWIYGPLTLRNNGEFRFTTDNMTQGNCPTITVEATGGILAPMGGTRAMTSSLILNGPLTIRTDDFDAPGTDRILNLNSAVWGPGSIVIRGNPANYISNSAYVQLGSAGYNHTGGTTIQAGGQLRFSADYCISDPSAPLAIAAAGVLNLTGGRTERVGKFSGAGDVSNGGTLIFGHGDTSTDGVFSGRFLNATALTKTGSGTTSLTGASTASGVVTAAGGTLRLDFSGSGAPASNILGSGAPLYVSGGTLELQGKSGTANAQTFNGTTANFPGSIKLTQNGATSLDVTLGALTFSGGGINFVGGTDGVTAGTPRFITTTSAGADNGATPLPGGSLWNGTNLASVQNVSGTKYIVPWTGAFNNIYTGTGGGTIVVPNSAAAEVAILEGGSAGAPNYLAAATASINSLQMTAATTASTIKMDQNSGGDTLVVGNGSGATGLIKVQSGAKGLTIGESAGQGYLAGNIGTAYLDLVSENAAIAQGIVVNSVLRNNSGGGTVGVMARGPVQLNGVNTFTGNTTVGENSTLEIGGAGLLNSGNYAGTITLNAGATFKYNSTATQQLGGIVGGPGSLVKDNTGTLRCNAANNYIGGTTVNNGTLILNSPNDSSANVGSLVINSAGTVEVLGGNPLWNGITIHRTITINGGTLRKTNIGTGNQDYKVRSIDMTAGTISSVAGFMEFFADFGMQINGSKPPMAINTHASGTEAVISAHWGTRSPGGSGSFGVPMELIFTTESGTTASGADLIFSGCILADNGAYYVTKAGPGVMAICGNNHLGNGTYLGFTGTLTISGGTLQIGDSSALGGSGASGSLNPVTPIVNNATLAFERTDSVLTQGTHFNTVISGTGGVTQRGSGTTYLNGNNTYAGATTVNAGNLNVTFLANYGQNSPIGTGAGVANAAALVLDGGALQYTGAGAQATDRLFTIGTAGGIIDASGGTLTIGSAGGAIGFASSSNPAALTLRGSGAGVLGGSLGDSGAGANVTSLAKSEAGTWRLTAANTFSGPVVVNAGTLYLNGANDSTPAVTVNGGTLGGTGSAGTATVTASSGSTVEGGADGLGTLTVGALALQNGSTAKISTIGNYVSTPAFDVVVSGGLTAAGTVTVKLIGAAPAGTGSAHLFRYQGAFAGFASLSLDTSEMTGKGIRSTFTLVDNPPYIDVNFDLDQPVWDGAGDGTWVTGGPTDGDWKNLSDSNPTDYLAGDAVLFDDTASGLTTVNIPSADVAPDGVVVSNSVLGYTLTGVYAIAGSTPLTKRGSAMLTLGTTNSFSGQLSVENGTLRVGAVNDAGANGPLGNSALAVALGASGLTGTLEYTGATASSSKPFSMTAGGTGAVQVDSAATTLTLSGAISGAGTLRKTGAGTLVLSGNGGYGALSIGAGMLHCAKKASLMSGSAGSWTPANITVDSAAILGLNVQASFTDQFVASDVATLLDSSHLGASTPTTGLKNGSYVAFDTTSAGGTVTIGGVVANPNAGANMLGVIKNGAGTLVLSADNTYTGPTIVNAGRLQVANRRSLGGTAVQNASLIINAGATNQITTTQCMYYLDGDSRQRGSVTINGGTLDNSYNAANNRDCGFTSITMAGGLWSCSGHAAAYFDIFNNGLDSSGNPLPITTLASTSTARITCRINTRNSINLEFTVAEGAADPDLLVSGILSPNSASGAITKTGDGLMSLTAANTYTGSTTVNGGTLQADLASNNNVINSSSALVLGGGTFKVKGKGTAGSSQTVASLTTTAGTSSQIVLDPNTAGANTTALTITSSGLVLNGRVLVDYTASTTFSNTVGNAWVVVPSYPVGPLPSRIRVKDSGGEGSARVIAGGYVVRADLATAPDLPQTGAVATEAYRVRLNAGEDTDGSLDMKLKATESTDTITVDTTLKAGGVLNLDTYVLGLNGMTISGTNAWSISAGTGGGLKCTTVGGTLTLLNNNTGAITLSAPILNNAGTAVALNGSGTVTLGGNSQYTGLLTIPSGMTVKLGTAGSGGYGPLGTTANETQVAATGVLDFNGYSLGTAETIRIKVGASLVNSSATAVYFQGTVGAFVESGTTRNIIADAGAIRINYVGFGGYDPYDWSLTLGGSGTGDNRVDGILLDRGNTVYKTGTGTWTVGYLRDQATTYGAAGITVNGGTLISTGNDSNANFYGPVTINTGTLKLGATGTSGANGPLGRNVNGTTVTGTGGALDLNGYTLAYTEPLTLNGSGVSSGGALLNSSATGASWAGAITLGSSARINCTQAGSSLSLTSTISIGGSTLTLGGAGDITAGSTISGTGGSVVKDGAGTLTLSGSNSYSGSTALSLGATRVYVGGSAINSAVSLAPTSGAGSLRVVVSDNALSWTCKSLSTGGAGSPNLTFDFGASVTPSAGVSPLVITGEANFSTKTPSVTIVATGSNLPPGTYPLITWGSNTAGGTPTTSNLVLPGGKQGTLSVDGNTLKLTVTETRTWKGLVDSNWDAATQNWWDPANSPAYYSDGASMTFGDTAAAGRYNVALAVAVSPGGILFNNTTNAYTVTGSGSGKISGSAALTKNGSNSLTLTGTGNDYTGTTEINAGTLRADHASALGSGGNITFAGGTLQYTANSAGADWATRFKNSTAGAIKLDLNGQALTLAGVIPSSNTGGMQLTGTAGTLTLSAANAYVGTTTIGAGTVKLGAAGAYPNSPLGNVNQGTTVGSGASLDLNGVTLATSEPLTLNGAGVSGGGALLNSSATTAATYSGVVTLASSARINSATAGVLLTLTGGVSGGANTATFGGAGDITLTGTGVTGAGASLVKDGTGTLTLNGASNYGGTTWLKSATTQVTANNGVGTASVVTLGDAATTAKLILGNAAAARNQQLAGVLVTGLGGSIVGGNASVSTLTVNNAASASLDAALGGGGANENNLALTKAGAGLLSVTTANTYTGATTINGGTLRPDVVGALSSGDITFTGGTLQYVAATAGTDWATRFVSSTSAVKLDVNGETVTLAGIVPSSNSGGLTLTGTAGTLVLSAANAYTGTTAINAGTLRAAHASALSAGNITFGGGTLQYTAASAGTDWATRFSGSSAAIKLDVNGQTVTLAGAIPAGNTGGLTLTGSAGTLRLSGVNSYTGATTVQAGKLVGVVGGSCASSDVTVSSGTLGVSVTSESQWTCRGLSTAAGAGLEFAFAVAPSASLAPMSIDTDVAFDTATAPDVTVQLTGSVAAGDYPLMQWTGSQSGMAPTTATLTGSMGGTAPLSIQGKTLVISIPSSFSGGSVILFQ